MIYKEFKGLKLSALGMGAMRLPVIDHDENRIDEAAALEMVDHAMAHGINYYDTAWDYHGGNSEPLLGKALRKYPRESYCFATKFPGYELENMSKVEEIFENQLEKTGLEYFDFYMYHNVCEMTIDGYLDAKNGIFDYLQKQKKKGRIRYLGLSAHGSVENMKRFLDVHGKDMDFCQIQLNYLDWTFQDARGKVELLKQYDIPVFVMEPVRGGRLAKLTEKQESVLRTFRPADTPVTWAFRFIQSIPEAVVTLSGMSDGQQLSENIRIFDTSEPLNGEEMDALLRIAEEMINEKAVPCTACRYCTGKCPQGLDIPYLLGLYNEDRFVGGSFITDMGLAALAEEKWPDKCTACGACQQVCPQQIAISDCMKELAAKQRGDAYFGDFNTLKSIFIPEPAMDRQIFYGDRIMLGRNIIKANTVVTAHCHPEEQISYVISGSCDIVIEGYAPRHAEAGAVAWFPSNVVHEVIVGDEDTEILDIFNPVRGDWKELFAKSEETNQD